MRLLLEAQNRVYKSFFSRDTNEASACVLNRKLKMCFCCCRSKHLNPAESPATQKHRTGQKDAWLLPQTSKPKTKRDFYFRQRAEELRSRALISKATFLCMKSFFSETCCLVFGGCCGGGARLNEQLSESLCNSQNL